MRLSDKLRELREDRGLEQLDVAKMTGLTSGYISHLEQGRKKNPSMNTLKKLSDAYGVPVSTLLVATDRDDIIPGDELEYLEIILGNEKIKELVNTVSKLSNSDIEKMIKIAESWSQ